MISPKFYTKISKKHAILQEIWIFKLFQVTLKIYQSGVASQGGQGPVSPEPCSVWSWNFALICTYYRQVIRTIYWFFSPSRWRDMIFQLVFLAISKLSVCPRVSMRSPIPLKYTLFWGHVMLKISPGYDSTLAKKITWIGNMVQELQPLPCCGWTSVARAKCIWNSVHRRG